MSAEGKLDERLVAAVTAYSARIRDAVLDQLLGAAVCSPLGVWLLLCACLAGAEEPELAELEAVVGCSRPEASELLGAFVDNVPSAIRAALVLWARDEVRTDSLDAWMAGLPTAFERGPLPSQPAADAWTERHTLGLIREFPMDLSQLDLALASALATRVSWREPYDVAAASEKFAPSSPWTGMVERVLWTELAWQSAIVDTAAAGLVAVHPAVAREDLTVICVSADPDRSRADVLAAAHEVSRSLRGADRLPGLSLFELPLGEGHSWTVAEREREAHRAGQRFESVTGVALPAWEVESLLKLMTSPAFGALNATRVLRAMVGDGPSDSRQVALARFDRYGFEAAAVTGMGIAAAGRPITEEMGIERTAELRFDHPFAALAVCRSPWGEPVRFDGLPVFEAWIDRPVEVPQG